MKKKKKQLLKSSSLGIKGIKLISTAFSILTTILPYLSYIKKVKDGVVALAELVVDIAIEVLGAISNAIVSLVCKFFPYAGFVLGWALGIVVDLLMEKIFYGQRVSKIKRNYSKRVKYTSNWRLWINYLCPSFASAF